jgi:hypothetical protein
MAHINHVTLSDRVANWRNYAQAELSLRVIDSEDDNLNDTLNWLMSKLGSLERDILSSPATNITDFMAKLAMIESLAKREIDLLASETLILIQDIRNHMPTH